MKIARVEAIPLSIPASYGADSWTLGTGGWQALDFCLVRVDTDAGITGWGEAFSYSCRRPVAAAVNEMIAPLAVGHDAADIDGLHSTIQKRLHIFGRFGIAAFALSGLDIALWDIAGKAAAKPLHALLGGARRSTARRRAAARRQLRVERRGGDRGRQAPRAARARVVRGAGLPARGRRRPARGGRGLRHPDRGRRELLLRDPVRRLVRRARDADRAAVRDQGGRHHRVPAHCRARRAVRSPARAALAPENGLLPVPRGSGLGAEPDADVMRRYRVD